MNLWKFIFIIIVLGLIIVASCYFLCPKTSESDNGEIEQFYFTLENYPRIDGSTSAHPLEMLIACKQLNISYYWSVNDWDDTKRLVPNASEPGKEAIAENITNKIVHHGTHDAYVNLIKNEADLILVARLPSEDELDFAKSLGVELEVKAIALDAFVFILNINNPVNNLIVENIQNIYTGNITNWLEVGGPNTNITSYQRNDNSGSQELMQTLVMKDLEMVDAPELVLVGMMGPINRLSQDQNGICYSVYYFEEFMAPNEKIKLCGINGVFPNYETIRTREYLYTTEVFVVIRNDLNDESPA